MQNSDRIRRSSSLSALVADQPISVMSPTCRRAPSGEVHMPFYFFFSGFPLQKYLPFELVWNWAIQQMILALERVHIGLLKDPSIDYSLEEFARSSV